MHRSEFTNPPSDGLTHRDDVGIIGPIDLDRQPLTDEEMQVLISRFDDPDDGAEHWKEVTFAVSVILFALCLVAFIAAVAYCLYVWQNWLN
jgi:hypothetical protein